MDDPPIFRAAKRRKFARSKETEEKPSAEETRNHQQPGQATNARSVSPEIDVSTIIKLRRQGKSRNAGIQVTNTKNNQNVVEIDESVDVPAESTDDYVKKMNSRFVGSTGQVVDVNKHMTAFIDSHMAKRHQSGPVLQPSKIAEDSSSSLESDSDSPETNTTMAGKSGHQKNSYQLSEVDLGPSAASINLVRTEAAIARAQAGLPPPVEQEKPRKRRKPRLGRDGKPMRPRPKKRRDSADIARDALVEQVLHEHALDVYDKKEEDGKYTTNDGKKADQPDDETFAEEFRQQFMDAMADRQQRQKASQAKVSNVTGSIPQGPKLGGGRSGRAKMAQFQAQANTDKAK